MPANLFRKSEKFQFLARHLYPIFFWPVVCLLTGGLLWGVIHARLEADRRLLEQTALDNATSLSRAYARYLNRALEHLDQLTLQAKYDWEKSGGAFRLEELKREGLFSGSQFGAVTIFDREGTAVTSTLPLIGPVSVRERSHFQFHQNDTSTALRIGAPVIGKISGKEIIQVSRRLNAPDGSFGGMVVVAVEPKSFTLFSDDPILESTGLLLALVGDDGLARVTKIGNAIGRADHPLLLVAPALEEGPALLKGQHWFADGQARFVAAQALDRHPFAAIVGLSRDTVLMPYEQDRKTYRYAAIGGGLMLALFAAVSMLLSTRLAWRKYLTDTMRSTYSLASEGGNEAYFMGRPIRDKTGYITDFRLLDCNERAMELTGLKREALINARASNLYPPAYFEELMGIFRKAMESGYYEDDHEVQSGTQINARWLHRRVVGTEVGLALTMRDITEKKDHERELIRLATHDALTGLPNRHWLMSWLPKAIRRAAMNRTRLAVLFIDLDDFKDVNDSSGHSAGDQLLRAVAARLQAVLRPGDHVVRLGGDEFTVILEGAGGEGEVRHQARRILQALHSPFEILQRRAIVAGSVGISMYPRDGRDAETLLKNADIAMYAAKAERKGRFRFYDEALFLQITARVNMEHDLGRAIEEDQFVVHYQPRVDAVTGELLATEALVRWMHPERGLTLPNEFIPLAECTGKIIALGELVMDKVCAQVVSWQSQQADIVPVSVNVSARQFNEGIVHRLVSSCLARHGVRPQLLEIELTESAMAGDLDLVVAEIGALNAMGVKVHVDDFGTGYSTLSLLHKLSMDVLKVDRAFTTELDNGREGEIFFRAIVSMAKALGMRVVAEGVEHAGQVRILQALSCDELQGNFISPPLPADAIPALVRKRFLLP